MPTWLAPERRPGPVSLIATAMSTALDKAIPTVSVDCAAESRGSQARQIPARVTAGPAGRHVQEQELSEQEQRRRQREHREAERRLVAGVHDRHLICFGDCDEGAR
jgi:hypothetical protein